MFLCVQERAGDAVGEDGGPVEREQHRGEGSRPRPGCQLNIYIVWHGNLKLCCHPRCIPSEWSLWTESIKLQAESR